VRGTRTLHSPALAATSNGAPTAHGLYQLGGLVLGHVELARVDGAAIAIERYDVAFRDFPLTEAALAVLWPSTRSEQFTTHTFPSWRATTAA